ncbi:Uncharacterised protein [Salmonella enterica subsp. enterica serovar Bovismorbificans]|uniref:Uncharacterized protein n=1 Tax=Salmonella enterica subsp. enterica serovar Bovismorbificans TaxID=58097 RepID=A0A655CVF4_SALET|nr:Uncharacterised protein [Salmonella enterica subsp. enterica serovar Bovismorbificans]CPR54368.1 Uncharacterised protein [Salmonella enterica subsp. enterica serovar Bovismorbificans]
MQSADLLLMVANCQHQINRAIQQFITPGSAGKRKALDHRLMKMTFLCENGRKQRVQCGRKYHPKTTGAVLFIAKQLLIKRNKHRRQFVTQRLRIRRSNLAVPFPSKQRIV